MRIILLLLLFFAISPVYAGVYENAMAGNKDVLLYIYSSYCRTCKIVAPYFDEVLKTHKELTGLKINADTPYGLSLLRKFNGRYVPYIVLSSPKNGKFISIDLYCMTENICMERVLKEIKN